MTGGTANRDTPLHLEPSLVSILDFSCSLISASSSLEASYRAETWLNGFSGLLSNSFLIFSFFWLSLSPSPVPSACISPRRRSSNCAYAALNRLSGCLSIFASPDEAVSDKASKALSMPDAFSDLSGWSSSPSSCDRSSARVFLTAVLLFFACVRAPRRLVSSSASRASRSAFFRA